MPDVDFVSEDTGVSDLPDVDFVSEDTGGSDLSDVDFVSEDAGCSGLFDVDFVSEELGCSGLFDEYLVADETDDSDLLDVDFVVEEVDGFNSLDENILSFVETPLVCTDEETFDNMFDTSSDCGKTLTEISEEIGGSILDSNEAEQLDDAAEEIGIEAPTEFSILLSDISEVLSE